MSIEDVVLAVMLVILAATALASGGMVYVAVRTGQWGLGAIFAVPLIIAALHFWRGVKLLRQG